MIRRPHAKRAAAGLAVVSLAAIVSALGAGCGGSDYADPDDASAPNTGDSAGNDGATTDGSTADATTDAGGDAGDGGGNTGDATADGAGDAGDGGSQGDARTDASGDAGLDVNVPIDANLDANLPLDGSLDGNLPIDAGLDGNLPIDAGLDGNLPIDAGLDATLPLDAGLDSGITIDAGLDATLPLDAGLDASLDAGLDGSLADRPLGSASAFAVLAGNSISSVGITTIAGDVGVSPGTNIAGLPALQPLPGSIHSNDSVAVQAQADLATAATYLGSRTCNPLNNRTGVNLGGKTLAPGVYCFDADAVITGALTLDAQGDPNARWIFQIPGSLTVAEFSTVLPINFGTACNVYWNVGTTADIGANGAFRGNLVAQGTVTAGFGTSFNVGRVLSRTGIVNLSSNGISKGLCP